MPSNNLGGRDRSGDTETFTDRSPEPAHRRWTADWEPIESVWLAWPHNRQTWPGRFDSIPSFFAELACEIAQTIPVDLIVPPDLARLAKECLRTSDKFDEHLVIRTHLWQSNDCWVRDYGPLWTELETGKLAVVDFAYNAWGGKYPPWDDDAKIARSVFDEVKQNAQVDYYERSTLCLEGGAITGDGAGRLIATASSVLTPNRNPGATKEQVALELHRRLGITEILWVDSSIDGQPFLAGDDTDGHIDQLARFVDPQTVVVASCRNRDDTNFAPLQSVLRQVRLWARNTAPRVAVHELEIPSPRLIDGIRVPESYCNFLRLGPDRLLLPSFGDDRADDAARSAMRTLLPGCRIDSIDCRVLVWGLGALHCASSEQPAKNSH